MSEPLFDDEKGDLVEVSGLPGLINYNYSSLHRSQDSIRLWGRFFSAAKLGLYRNLYYENSPSFWKWYIIFVGWLRQK